MRRWMPVAISMPTAKSSDAHDVFGSAYFLELGLPRQQLEARIPSLFTDDACGRVLRVKGFVQDAAGWVELNATADGLTAAPIPAGQEVLIVIGEGLDRFAVHRPGRSRHVGVRFLPGPFLFHSFSGKI